MLDDLRLQGGHWHIPGDAFDHFAPLEQHQGWDTHDAKLHQDSLIEIGIDFTHPKLTRVFFGKLVNQRRDHTAGCTPFSPKVNQNGQFRFEYIGFESGFSNFKRFGIHLRLLSIQVTACAASPLIMLIIILSPKYIIEKRK
jgi:hypothetical protein